MNSDGTGLFAVGDNSYKQLFTPQQGSIRFVQCSDLEISGYEINHICSWNDTFAILANASTIIYINPETCKTTIQLNQNTNQIQIHQNNFVFINQTNQLHQFDCSTQKSTLLSSKQFKSCSCSSKFICGITTDKECLLIQEPNKHKHILSNALVCGCTDANIFISKINSPNIFIYNVELDLLKQLTIQETVVSISCSDDISLFITETGLLYRFSFNDATSKPIRVFGLPPIVSASCGPQHCAAITENGALYTWGFNPSAQLGIGSDRPCQTPTKVIENGVFCAACGSHNTWIVKNNRKPVIVEYLKVQQPKVQNEMSQVPRKSESFLALLKINT